MKIVTVLFLIATPIFISSALAENVGLDKIVVTPYRMEIHSENSSLSTEEIDVREAEKKGVSLLKNVLAESSSIVSASSGGLGGDTSIFLRGHNSHHTRFMLDGIKIYDPISTTAYYSFTHFHLQGIEEIEISKGPQSSLYGSDAIGGVISLFTKKGIGEPKFSFKQKVGSYNTYEESLDFSGEHKNLGYYLGIARTDIGGFSLAKEKNNNTERDPYHNLNASLRLDYEFSDKTTLNLITRYIYAKYEYDGSSWTPPYLPTDDNDNYAYDNEAIVGFKLKQYINDKLDYKLILSKTNVYRKSWEDISSDSYYLGDTYQVDNQLDLKLADCYKIIIGFDYLREKGDSYRVDSGTVSDFPKETANNRGYFIENILEPAENLNFAFSYRRDEHSTFEDE
ncbi:MAG: TonB-dependent receptor plug domain-containing protein, partial [Candidatus Omnitrophica bacterium]|nr:TonB-dependent receptor plug domain-containing protein [Candidatus Omnitrophota bacterium]